ncbi:unnamed protein product, partial [Polarella glacialis]
LSGLVAVGSKSGRAVAERAVLRLEDRNTENWRASNEDASTATPIPAAVFEICREDVETLRELFQDYLANDLLRDHTSCRYMARLIGRALCIHASGLLLPPTAPVHVVLDIEVPATLACDRQAGSPIDLFVLGMHATLVVDVSLAGWLPKVTGARFAISEETLNRCVESMQDQIMQQDLRSLHPGLRDFTEPILASFDLRLDWPQQSQPRILVRNAKAKLHLPQ